MKYIFSLIMFAVFATGITSCESDSTSGGSSSTTKELEVTPSKTSVGIYETFDIKARMTNMPLSDVLVKIDYGDGRIETLGAGVERTHSYTIVGTYTITVKAIDEYTRDTLATKSIQIIVSDVVPMVAFDRDIIDTAIQISDYGAELGGVTFTFTTNTFISKVRYQFGDGVTLIDSTDPSYSISHAYQSVGTYTVILDVYNDKGNYWDSDTMTCTIRLQEATLDMLTSSYNISVRFAVDSTSSIYPSITPYGVYTEAGIGAANDATPDVTWTGNSFTAQTVYGGNEYLHFTGTISSDLKKLETMTVSILDSAYAGEESKLGYKLSNLEFYGMNSEVVIYRAVNRELSSFASDIYLSGHAGSVRSAGSTSDMIYHIRNLKTPAPYAYVVFTR
jgi:PKD repeat protein